MSQKAWVSPVWQWRVFIHLSLFVRTSLCSPLEIFISACVPASCCISTVLFLPWYYPSGHYHYVPSSGLTAPHTRIICSVKKKGGARLISMLAQRIYPFFPTSLFSSSFYRILEHFFFASLLLFWSILFLFCLLLTSSSLSRSPSLCNYLVVFLPPSHPPLL